MDSLPIQVSKEEMKPGDLVFTLAPLYDTSNKCKEHNCTHVEVRAQPHTHTETQTQIHTHIHTHTQTDMHTQTDTLTQRGRERERERDTCTHCYSRTCPHYAHAASTLSINGPCLTAADLDGRWRKNPWRTLGKKYVRVAIATIRLCVCPYLSALSTHSLSE